MNAVITASDIQLHWKQVFASKKDVIVHDSLPPAVYKVLNEFLSALTKIVGNICSTKPADTSSNVVSEGLDNLCPPNTGLLASLKRNLNPLYPYVPKVLLSFAQFGAQLQPNDTAAVQTVTVHLLHELLFGIGMSAMDAWGDFRQISQLDLAVAFAADGELAAVCGVSASTPPSQVAVAAAGATGLRLQQALAALRAVWDDETDTRPFHERPGMPVVSFEVAGTRMEPQIRDVGWRRGNYVGGLCAR